MVYLRDPEKQGRIKSWLQFIELFTEAEQLAIVAATMSDPTVKLWYDKAQGANYIDLDDPRVIDGFQALIDRGLLTTVRRDRVLAGLAPA